MSELFLKFGEAQLKVEGDADLVERERKVFLERLAQQHDKAVEAATGLIEAMKKPTAIIARAGKVGESQTVEVLDGAAEHTVPESGDVLQGVSVGTCPDTYNMRAYKQLYITPAMLRTNKAAGKLDELLHPFDEIDVPLTTGGTVTVVCGYVTPTTARFVFKDCWDEHVMNQENTNKTGYYKSAARKHILEDILPNIAPEWREIIVPRTIVEIIDGERVEYNDAMWLPSATDVFGVPDDAWWKDEGDDFQLPIFKRERDRVKECGDEGTYPWWLRSVNATGGSTFCGVRTDGSATSDLAHRSRGFAPGFDIYSKIKKIPGAEAPGRVTKSILPRRSLWEAITGGEKSRFCCALVCLTQHIVPQSAAQVNIAATEAGCRRGEGNAAERQRTGL